MMTKHLSRTHLPGLPRGGGVAGHYAELEYPSLAAFMCNVALHGGHRRRPAPVGMFTAHLCATSLSVVPLFVYHSTVCSSPFFLHASHGMKCDVSTVLSRPAPHAHAHRIHAPHPHRRTPRRCARTCLCRPCQSSSPPVCFGTLAQSRPEEHPHRQQPRPMAKARVPQSCRKTKGHARQCYPKRKVCHRSQHPSRSNRPRQQSLPIRKGQAE